MIWLKSDQSFKLQLHDYLLNHVVVQGYQMVCFQTKSPNLGKFWRALECKTLVYSKTLWNILRPFSIFHGHWVILWQFGIFPLVLVHYIKEENSGNPVLHKNVTNFCQQRCSI
jgi:hypothetical protein